MASSIRNHLVRISIDDAYPNVYFIDRDAKPFLIQINLDQYELRQGRCLLGVIIFQNGNDKWGWRFFPNQTGKRPSRVLYPNPEAAVKGRFAISDVFPMKSSGLLKD